MIYLNRSDEPAHRPPQPAYSSSVYPPTSTPHPARNPHLHPSTIYTCSPPQAATLVPAHPYNKYATPHSAPRAAYASASLGPPPPSYTTPVAGPRTDPTADSPANSTYT